MKAKIILAAILALACAGAEDATAKQKSAKDLDLLHRAQKECNGPKYPGGAVIEISYKRGTFRCRPVEGSRR